MNEPKIRSEILETGNPKIKSARILVNAPAEKIFALLSNPRKHSQLDGTGTVKDTIFGPEKLVLGLCQKFYWKRGGPIYHQNKPALEIIDK